MADPEDLVGPRVRWLYLHYDNGGCSITQPVGLDPNGRLRPALIMFAAQCSGSEAGRRDIDLYDFVYQATLLNGSETPDSLGMQDYDLFSHQWLFFTFFYRQFLLFFLSSRAQDSWAAERRGRGSHLARSQLESSAKNVCAESNSGHCGESALRCVVIGGPKVLPASRRLPHDFF